MCIFGIVHFVFSDCNRRWVTETVESETEDKGVYNIWNMGIRQKTMIPERRKEKVESPTYATASCRKSFSRLCLKEGKDRWSSVDASYWIYGTDSLSSPILTTWMHKTEYKRRESCTKREVWSYAAGTCQVFNRVLMSICIGKNKTKQKSCPKAGKEANLERVEEAVPGAHTKLRTVIFLPPKPGNLIIHRVLVRWLRTILP